MRYLSHEMKNLRRTENEAFKSFQSDYTEQPQEHSSGGSGSKKRPRVSPSMQAVHRFLSSELPIVNRGTPSRCDAQLGMSHQMRSLLGVYRQYAWTHCPLNPLIFDEKGISRYLSRACEESCPLTLASTFAVCMGTLTLF